MRKIIVYNVVSLDGYHTRPGQRRFGHVRDDGQSLRYVQCWIAEGSRRVARGSRFLRPVHEFLAQGRPESRVEEWTPSQRELSKAGQSARTVVVSDTLTGNWPDVRIIRRADAYQQIADLKRQPGKDILITGQQDPLERSAGA